MDWTAVPGRDSVWSVTIGREELVDSLDALTTHRIAATLASQGGAAALGDSARMAVRLARSVQTKLRAARENPVWDAVIVSGALARVDSTWVVRTDSGAVRLDLSNMSPVAPELAGRVVVAKGAVRKPDVVDVLRLFERKSNTLEVFVMSLCPFGRKTEKEILTRVQGAAPGAAPVVEVRYIFYNETPGRGRSYASMHGEKEIAEDLVQIVIREDFPKAYHRYLLLRADSDEPWATLASRAGLDFSAIRRIEQRVRNERKALIDREYEYVAGTHDVYDRSPSYVWEGRVVRNLQSVPFFADAVRDSASCSR